MNIRVPPPRPLIRPQVPLLTLDPLPPPELEEDQQQQVETASILGDRPGVEGPGLPDADGRGDGGTAEEGLFRIVPPSPRHSTPISSSQMEQPQGVTLSVPSARERMVARVLRSISSFNST